MFLFSGVFKLLGDLCGLVGPLSISYIVEFINSQLSHETTSSSTTASAVVNYDAGAMGDSNFHNENNITDETAAVLLINYPGWSEFIANGWIMSGIVLISFLLQGTFSQASTNIINIEGIKIKNALQGLIYRKTLSLSASCFYKISKSETAETQQKEAKEGESDDDYDLNNPGTITNLMSDDSLNIMTFFWICHYIWSIPLKVSFTKRAKFYGTLIAS